MASLKLIASKENTHLIYDSKLKPLMTLMMRLRQQQQQQQQQKRSPSYPLFLHWHSHLLQLLAHYFGGIISLRTLRNERRSKLERAKVLRDKANGFKWLRLWYVNNVLDSRFLIFGFSLLLWGVIFFLSRGNSFCFVIPWIKYCYCYCYCNCPYPRGNKGRTIPRWKTEATLCQLPNQLS